MSKQRNRKKALRYETAAYLHPNARPKDEGGSKGVSIVNVLMDMLHQRERENQLTFLTPQRCRELFEHVLNGEMAEPCFAFRQMELYDDDIFGGRNSRLSALDEMPWRITVKADAVGDNEELKKLAATQQDYLQGVFARVDNLEEALRALGEADFRGVAALELTGTPGKRMVWEVIEPYMLARPVPGGDWYYNAEAAPTLPPTGLEELDEERVIIREAPPILVPAMFIICSKHHGAQGWDGFLDKFGNPSIFAEMPINCTEEERAMYDEIMRSIVGEGSGTIPAGTKFQTIETRQNSADSYRDRVQACKEALITLCTGGLLTMAATADTGALAGGAHSDSLARLCRASARGITAAVNTYFTNRILRDKFGADTPLLARFEFAPVDEEDKQVQANIVATLTQAGYRPSAATVSEMMGFEVTEVQENVRGTMYEVRSENLGAAAPRGYDIMNTTPAAAAPAEQPPFTPEELELLRELGAGKLNHDRIAKTAGEAEKTLTAAVEEGKRAGAAVSPA